MAVSPTKYLQTALGYSLTSDTSLHALFFLYGPTLRNGKNTVADVMRHVLGSYAGLVDISSLTEGFHSEHRNDLASLAGATRMVVTEESTDGNVWDEGRVKQLTGGSGVKVRHIRAEAFEYKPEYKIWFLSNNAPVIKELSGSGSVLDRIKVIPFDYHIPESARRGDYAEMLVREEGAGILNWCLAGLRRYVELGCKLPKCVEVEQAVQAYKEDMDILKRFADDCLMFSEDCGRNVLSPRTDLYKKYVEWCGDNGHKYTSSRKFYTAFLSRFAKVFEHRQSDARKFHGVCVRDSSAAERVIESDDAPVQVGEYRSTRAAYDRLTPEQREKLKERQKETIN